jgi:hypothetical protein
MILNESAHVFLNLKKKQFLRNDPGTHKKTENVKYNKTITALYFVQYDAYMSIILKVPPP